MSIEDFGRMSLRYAGLILACVVLATLVGLGYFLTRTPVYEASALGYVVTGAQAEPQPDPPDEASEDSASEDSEVIDQPLPQPVPIGPAGEAAEMFIPFFTTRNVADRIIETTGLDMSSGAVAGSLSASVNPSAPVVTVTATGATPEAAQNIANAAIEATAEEAQNVGPGQANVAPGYVLVPYQSALLPGAPVSPDPVRILGIAAGVGLVIGYVLAFLRTRADTKVRTSADFAKVADVPVLGVVPSDPDFKRVKGRLREPQAFHSKESLRKLRTNLRFLGVDDPPRSIVVTSSFQGEGKSTIAANLARVLAESGQRVILIDADLRRPSIHTAYGIDGTVGLSQLLTQSVELTDVLQPTSTPNLAVIPAGQIPPNPSELLGSVRMQELVAGLSRDAFVLVDAPPLLPVTDGVLLTAHTDGAIVVTASGKTRIEHVKQSLGNLEAVGARPLGLVLNHGNSRMIDRLIYGDAEYGYYGGYSKYGKGYTESRKARKARQKALKAAEERAEADEPSPRLVPAGSPAGAPAQAASGAGVSGGPAAGGTPAQAPSAPAAADASTASGDAPRSFAGESTPSSDWSGSEDVPLRRPRNRR